MSALIESNLIQTIRQAFDDDMLKSTFFDILCRQLSHRTIVSIDPLEFIEFTNILYDFFIVRHPSETAIYVGEPQLSSKTLTNRLILKISQPDAPYLFVTIEEIVRQYNLRYTRRLHPIIGIIRDETGRITDLVPPESATERRSLVFMAFEPVSNPRIVAEIESKLTYHARCIQQVQTDSEHIRLVINTVAQELIHNKPSGYDEAHQLITWLLDQNFSFFGLHIGSEDGVRESYGICQKTVGIDDLSTPHSPWFKPTSSALLCVDQIPIVSPLQRFEPLMRVSFRIAGTLYAFYGILKRSSMYAKNSDTPIINKKMAYIFSERHFLPETYNYNDVIRIFNDIPKYELFRTPKEDLLQMVDFVMSITNLNHIQLYSVSTDLLTLRLYIVVPHHLFSPHTVTVITTHIQSLLTYDQCDVLPIAAPEKCRIHMRITLKKPQKLPPEETLERTLTAMVQPWEEQVRQLFSQECPEILANDPNILQKIPTHYPARTTPQAAVMDIQRLVQLRDSGDIYVELSPFDFPKKSDLAGKASLIVVYHYIKLDLTDILPIFHNSGIHVIDQMTFRFGDDTDTIGYVLAFRVVDASKQKMNEDRVRDRLVHLLGAVLNKTVPNDPLNQLVLKTTLTVDAIFVLQAFRNYMAQVFSAQFSKAAINQACINHPQFCQHLSDYFDNKFNPDMTVRDRNTAVATLGDAIMDYIKQVTVMIDDHILRRMASIVMACLRTNVRIRSAGEPISFKLDPSGFFGLPTPIPYRETFVFDTDLEGVHIRFGAVARGGLRWSDRLDDYRTEVMGLVKTQQTKNAVIIPVGSKGGFVIKSVEQPDYDMGVYQYKRFITGMLQLVDNIVGGKDVSPPIVMYDSVDPYFVVAADKGTATFSDYANQVSLAHQFWLGDGFASGGANGYDHKKVAITAKGAWECTKLHFAAMGMNPEKDAISVVGIGDMSGDVFGNGMLQSRSIKLVGAFNHRHIFLDPNPDPKTSWAERKRLFDLPRSTWNDYGCVSEGGGIFERSAKSIALTPAVQQLLQTTETALSGEAIIQLLLRLPVDLMWFGGIGTYIKSSAQSHSDVGDPANNAVRINAADCRARVISEGANLGVTQLGRIEYELSQNGRINTDAIDNSAGVNMSDYEVNIKIILATWLNHGVIADDAERNRLLEEATDEVTALVLQNNVSQHELLSMDSYRSQTQPFLIDYTISELIKLGQLNHIDEHIPPSKQRQELYRQQLPLPRPVLAVCQAYVKMRIKQALMTSDRLSGPVFDALYRNYFPITIQSVVPADQFPEHRLKKNIIVTQVTNYLVGIFGCASYESLTFFDRVPIDVAVHDAMILDAIVGGPACRERFRNMDTESAKRKALFSFNQSLLYAVYFCQHAGLDLAKVSISACQERLTNAPAVQSLPLSLQCLFLDNQSPDRVQRLNDLDKAIGIIRNLDILCQVTTTSHMIHEQKLAILSDLYTAIIRLFRENDASFSLVVAADNPRLSVVGQDDVLAQLVLYSFELRRWMGTMFV
jgi:glutamate dehydrogenase